MAYYGYWGKQFVEDAGELTVSGTTAVTMPAGRPLDIKRIVLVTTTALTTADAVITIGKRKLDGSDAEDHSAWTLVQSGSALNDVSEILVAESLADADGTEAVDGLTVHDAGNELLELEPGEEFVIESDGGPDAGAVRVFVQYQEQGVTGTRYDPTKLVETDIP